MSSRATPSVYLSGPISGQSYKGAINWREYARDELAKVGIKAFSPMRNKEFLSSVQVLSGAPEAYVGSGLANPKGITTRDRFDTRTCDLMLVNLLPAEENGVISIGTMIEVGWADAFRVPIIAVMGPGNPHRHAMLVEVAGYIFPTLEEGLAITKAVLLP